MDAQTARAWLTLIRAPGGRYKKREAIEAAGSVEAVVAASSSLQAKMGLSSKTQAWLGEPDKAAIDADMDWLTTPECHLITPSSTHWPTLLDEIPDPPLALFVRGNPALLSEPQLAMVGSRNPTPVGRDTARDFARFLAHSGLVITSGLALGIDGASHRGALDGQQPTIAVCGTGLDRIYPARHGALARDIVAHGALVSEYPTGVKPRQHHFPERNRLVSGLSLGVLVVEAAHRSGSLISARLASEQGREVFAIPGSIHNPLAHGCHRLIRDGAKLVQQASDVLEELAPLLTRAGVTPAADDAETQAASSKVSRQPVLSEQAQAVLKSVDFAPTTIDSVVETCGLTTSAVSAMLITLELDGHIATAPGGGYMRTSK